MSKTQNVLNLPLDFTIHDIKYNLYGNLLCASGTNGTIIIYQVNRDNEKSLTELLRKEGAHQGPVWRVEFCHPVYGNYLASCSLDKIVKIWEISNNTLVEVFTYESHESSVNCISWAPQPYGFILACCSSDGYISVLNDGNWQNPQKWKASEQPLTSISWAPKKLSECVATFDKFVDYILKI